MACALLGVGRHLRPAASGHVGALVESKFHQRQARNIARLDALYARNIQQQVHILLAKIGFHLVGSETTGGCEI